MCVSMSVFVCVCVCARVRENSLMNYTRKFFNPLTPAANSHIITDKIFFFHSTTAPSDLGTFHYRGITIALRYITFDRTPLDEW